MALTQRAHRKPLARKTLCLVDARDQNPSGGQTLDRRQWLAFVSESPPPSPRIISGASSFLAAPVSEWLQLIRCIHNWQGTDLCPHLLTPSGESSWQSSCSSIVNPRKAAPSRLLRRCRLCREPGTSGCKNTARRSLAATV